MKILVSIKNFLLLKWSIFLAWIIIVVMLVVSFSAFYRDQLLTKELVSNGWGILLEKEYFKNLVISPLWILVGFLFNYSTKIENTEYKRKENLLFGHLKGKNTVDVIDIREIMQNYYNQDNELENLRNERRKLAQEVGRVEDNELTP